MSAGVTVYLCYMCKVHVSSCLDFGVAEALTRRPLKFRLRVNDIAKTGSSYVNVLRVEKVDEGVFDDRSSHRFLVAFF